MMTSLTSLWPILENAPSQSPLVLSTMGLFALVVGSFFNVVIHRLSCQMEGESPKEINTCKPAKSFCPKCKKQLSWKENIPVFSWLIQLGKCRGCKAPISIQYPLVELASAAIAITAMLWAPTLGAAIISIVFLDILLLTAVIDARTKKIPNKLTLPGIAILFALSLLPGGLGIKVSAIGIVGCFLMMWGMAELGKKLFGKKTVTLKKAQPFLWTEEGLRIQDEDDESLEGSELMGIHDLPFLRSSDRIRIDGTIEKISTGDIIQKLTQIDIGPTESSRISGLAKSITFPREAMGMGDAKLLALAGAAMGFLPSVHGLVAGTLTAITAMIVMRVVAIARKGNAPSLIAFGPWIAIGCAAVWIWNQLHPAM